MLQAVEAVIREGRIRPVEPISMEENARFLLVRLQPHQLFTVAREARREPGILGCLRFSRGLFDSRLT